MTEKDKKRFKHDERRQHVDKLTGEKWKHKIQQEKINEADRDIREYTHDFCCTYEEHPSGNEGNPDGLEN